MAQLDEAESIIFCTEARTDSRQSIDIPLDEPSEERKADGFTAFRRYACKMATGSGKTTVMGMLAAWSILNKVHDRGNARFSDVILVVCPNVTIRSRLAELDPANGEASIYRSRDLVPLELMKDLTQGKVEEGGTRSLTGVHYCLQDHATGEDDVRMARKEAANGPSAVQARRVYQHRR